MSEEERGVDLLYTVKRRRGGFDQAESVIPVTQKGGVGVSNMRWSSHR